MKLKEKVSGLWGGGGVKGMMAPSQIMGPGGGARAPLPPPPPPPLPMPMIKFGFIPFIHQQPAYNSEK